MDAATTLPVPEEGAERAERMEPIASGKLAMWIFLSSEVMFFAGLIGTYVVLRISNPAVFEPEYLERAYHSALNVPLAGLNTLVLITSSLTMALAVQASHIRNNRKCLAMLVATALLGLVFCGFKFVEYSAKFDHGVGPGTSIFYSCYFTLTGIHLLHVAAGVVPILGLALVGRDGRFIRDGNLTVEVMGLYWHFVDVVWIFLFPLLYLLK